MRLLRPWQWSSSHVNVLKASSRRYDAPRARAILRLVKVRAGVAEQYADFASYARADSPCFAAWATELAEDPEVVAWLSDLPALKRQPNLVFAAARWHGVPAPGPYVGLRDALLADDRNGGPIRATIRARRTQTNEVGRLATLLPVFARIAQETGRPLALLEVGASAGLCLYPDRYEYDWPPVATLNGSGGPRLRCVVDGPMPEPTAHPEVAWRGGIDLNPLDVTDPDTRAWLETLVWPEHDDRRALLAAAADVVAADPPTLVRGDLLTELPALVDVAARHGEVVVFHSAVIAYLTTDDRASYDELVRGLVADGRCRWVSNEGHGVLPSVTRTAPPAPPEHEGSFVLGLDGRAVAWTHPHGRTMTWVDE